MTLYKRKINKRKKTRKRSSKRNTKVKRKSQKRTKKRVRKKTKKNKIVVVSCDAIKDNKKKKTKKIKDNAIIYMKESCPYSKQSYKTLVKKFGKNNVMKRYIETKEIIPIRKGLSEKYKHTDGTTVPFVIVNNKKFIGSNTEVQKIYN